MSTHPEVLWAQRSSDTAPEKNIIYLTVNLPDILESSLQYALTSTNLSFRAIAGSGGHTKQYAFDLELYAEVDAENSTKRLTSRSVLAVLRKKELKSEYWPRLTKEKLKTPFIKTDFGKWVDEDEQDGAPEVDDDFGMGMGMGGLPGMGGEEMPDFSKLAGNFNAGGGGPADEPAESDDSDDSGPPPLEEDK